jgi:hypothetical protein
MSIATARSKKIPHGRQWYQFAQITRATSSATAGRNVGHARDGTWYRVVKPKEKSEDHPPLREES